MQYDYNYGSDALQYWDIGSGTTTVLLIHGFCEDNRIWESQITFLSKYYRVIAPNLPGVHCTPLPIHHSEPPSMRHYVEVLHELMHHLKIDQYYIMGHSMGGYIGLAFADYYVNHVMGLGLIHSTTYADSDAKKESRMKVAEFLQEWGTEKYVQMAIPNLFSSRFKKENQDAIQHIIEWGANISNEALIQFVMAMRNRPANSHLLSQNRIPIWMIVGEEDIAISIEDSLAQTQLLPPQNVIVLKEVGHMGMIEASDIVNQSIHRFLQNALS